MPRPLPKIHIEVIEKDTEPTEDDMRRWVRVTEILLRIKARRNPHPGALKNADGTSIEPREGNADPK